jgi:hypothetical protein
VSKPSNDDRQTVRGNVLAGDEISIVRTGPIKLGADGTAHAEVILDQPVPISLSALMPDPQDRADLFKDLASILTLESDRFDDLVAAGGMDPAIAFVGTDLAKSEFCGSAERPLDLRGWNFSGADMTGALFQHVIIDRSTKFDGAKLDGIVGDDPDRVLAFVNAAAILRRVRLVTTPIKLVDTGTEGSGDQRFLCQLLLDCTDLSLWSGDEVEVVLSSTDGRRQELPAGIADYLTHEIDEDNLDDEKALSFDGVELLTPGDRPVLSASSCGGRRPSRELAESVIDAFLTETLGELDVPFELHEDGDESSAPGKCGWSFWVRSEDTTSYLHEGLGIEWYGTGYDPDDEHSDEPSP